MGCYPTQLFMNLRVGPAGANSSWKHRTPNIQRPTSNGLAGELGVGCWMLDVFLASPLVDGFYKNQIDDFRPAAGGGAAKILRKARWVGRKATSHSTPSHRMTFASFFRHLLRRDAAQYRPAELHSKFAHPPCPFAYAGHHGEFFASKNCERIFPQVCQDSISCRACGSFWNEQTPKTAEQPVTRK